MKVILNDNDGSSTFSHALAELGRGANTLSLAVSYLQVSGWNILRKSTAGLDYAKMRIVCTDQLGITHPEVIARALSKNIQIRNYRGNNIFHSKVYIAHNKRGNPIRFLVASANLSQSALTNSVEAGVLSNDATCLWTINKWFDSLFQNRSVQFTPERLRVMEANWKANAISRARARLKARHDLWISQTSTPVPLEAEDIDALEDVFATVKLPLGLLNMDYAGNNIRNIGRVREILANWDTNYSVSKYRSELKLLGFHNGRDLTPLGQTAAAAASSEEVARLWCAWLKQTSDDELFMINERLLAAKRVYAQFWRLMPEVRQYFLENAENPSIANRKILQTIELLSNASDVVQAFTLEDMTTLAPLLRQPARLPEYMRKAISDYQDNKGTRGWSCPDRKIVPNAWQQA